MLAALGRPNKARPGGHDVASNAKPRDMQAGWQIYRESGYSADLEGINQQLIDRGFGPVADRSYKHYQKLHRYGYQRYVPINVLDVETHQVPPWGQPLRSRYRPRPRGIDVQLIVATADRSTAVDAHTVEMSNAEVSIRVTAEAIETLHEMGIDSLEGTHVLLVLARDAPEAVKAAEVELVFPEPEHADYLITLAFLTPLSTVETSGQTLISAGTATVTLEIIDPSSPDVLIRTLTALFEAVDASRALTDEILGKLDSAGTFALPTIQVDQLTMSSPLIVVLGGPTVVISFLYWQIRRILKARDKFYEGSIKKSQSDEIASSANVNNAKAELLSEQTRAIRIHNDLAAAQSSFDPMISVDAIVRLLERAVPQLPGASLAKDEVDDVAELFQKQVLPSLEKLLSGTLKSIDIRPDSETEEELEALLPEDADESEPPDD